MSTAPGAARTVVFLGDSITDAERLSDPEDLGSGYVRMIAEHLAAHEVGARVINRGVAGERIRDVAQRFTEDCLDLHPDVLTLYAGVNDALRASDDPTSPEALEAEYRFCLDQQINTQPATPVIVILPFLTAVDESISRCRDDLDIVRERVEALAREFGCEVIDAQELMDQALTEGHTAASLAADGVHPTTAGHRLLADAWLAALAETDAHRED